MNILVRLSNDNRSEQAGDIPFALTVNYRYHNARDKWQLLSVTDQEVNRCLGRAFLPYLYLLPAFMVMGVITFYPLVYQVIISFTDFQTKDLIAWANSPKLNFIGFQNYIDIFTGGLPVQNFEFFRVLTYNFWWAITNVMVHVPAGVLIAVLTECQGLWFKKIYRAIYILPVVIPPIVVATVWRNIFDEQYGAMNQLLTWIAHLFGSGPIRCTSAGCLNMTPPIPWLLPNWALAAGLLRHDDRQLLVGLAIHDAGCHRCAAKHPQGSV